MLQINKIIYRILFLSALCLVPAISNAQVYQPGQVPAFLQNEAAQQNQQPQFMQQQQQPQQMMRQPLSQTVPAFLQQENQQQMQQQQQEQYQQQMQQLQQQQNQYHYQSADPTATGTNILPPAIYQPAPGDVPAFVNQNQDNNSQPEEPQKLKTNQKEDVIQINFTDDQYKSDDNVTTLSKDQATQYNTEAKQNSDEKAKTSEIPEGAKFEGGNNADQNSDEDNRATPDVQTMSESDIRARAMKEKEATKAAVPEPAKSTTNIMRITYSKEGTELSDKDKASLLSVVKLLKGTKTHILITALTSERELGLSASKVGLMRIIGIRNFLMKQGVDFSQTEVKVVDSEKNIEDLDYIDIDKI